MIRGVDSNGTMYKLLEYNLIEPAGKSDLPGKPMTYKVISDFMKMFGIKTLDELPELPKYKLDSNSQIIIDDLIETDNEKNNKQEKEDKNVEIKSKGE